MMSLNDVCNSDKNSGVVKQWALLRKQISWMQNICFHFVQDMIYITSQLT